MCGVVIEHDGREVLGVRGDHDDPFSRGHICPKAVALGEVHHDPNRLRKPQRRTGRHWADTDWKTALDECVDRLHDIQSKYGRHAVGVYIGNPSVHNAGTLLFAGSFLKALRSFNRYSATSVDQLPQMLAAYEMFGHPLLMPVPDLDRCRHLIIFGANPLVSNGSIMSAPGMKKRLAAIRAGGGKVIVVDPRRTETADRADEHIAIRPGTDALLLAAMLHTLFAEERIALGRLRPFTEGVEQLGASLRGFAAESASEATGVPAETIRRLARDFAAAEAAAAYGRVGICLQRFGGLSAWLLYALNVVTGKLDAPGGLMFTRPAADLVRAAAAVGERGHFDKGRSRGRGLPEFNGEYPVSTLADEIETPGEGQIRALVTIAGNPVLSTPNGRRLSKAMEKLDFMVSLDLYRNETTRHADFILPPTSTLQQSHYDVAFNLFAVRNVAKYSPPLFPRGKGEKHDWEILLELTTRLSARRAPWAKVASRLAQFGASRLGPDGILDQMLRWGPYGAKAGRRGMSLRHLKTHPHGLDLGPLEPALPDRLMTRRKRVALSPPRLATDMRRLAEFRDEPPPALSLIGRRELRTNNSWLHNSPALVKGPARCRLWMHPDDAAARGLRDGVDVVVRSRVGEVVVPLAVDDSLRPGVVSLPHGYGHDRQGVALDVARAEAPGVSINDLTDETVIDELSGNAVLNGVPVEVSAALAPTGSSPLPGATPDP